MSFIDDQILNLLKWHVGDFKLLMLLTLMLCILIKNEKVKKVHKYKNKL